MVLQQRETAASSRGSVPTVFKVPVLYCCKGYAALVSIPSQMWKMNPRMQQLLAAVSSCDPPSDHEDSAVFYMEFMGGGERSVHLLEMLCTAAAQFPSFEPR